MFGMFKVKKKVETPAEAKLEEIKNLLFPPLETRHKDDVENKIKNIKYQVDHSVDSNLEAVLYDLEEGYNDETCHETISAILKRLDAVRRVLDAHSIEIDPEADYIVYEINKKESLENILAAE